VSTDLQQPATEPQEAKKPSRQLRQHEIVEGADAPRPIADYGHFLLWTTLGNVVGGSFFVAFIKYSYAIRGKFPGALAPLAEAGRAERKDRHG
jgi:hypothetical protein